MTAYGMTSIFCSGESCVNCSIEKEARKYDTRKACTEAMDYLYKYHPKYVYENLIKKLELSKERIKFDKRYEEAEREFEEYFRSVE